MDSGPYASRYMDNFILQQSLESMVLPLDSSSA
ncbi:hypothetical protein HNQ80_002906 [Anaerosolibacter carboniphilus]|uniref:Uncharacterized protein n=1 Tax=Anaerosolibacter carboniphilus TaxID=1417629 RepID=A0A841L0U8_9FIRM|nr:hypothetical protein [Anaerosolibacter carboniphilus]